MSIHSALVLKKINYLFKFVIFFLLISCAYHLFFNYFNFPNIPQSFLFDSSDRFNDWHNSITSSRASNPYFSDSPALATYFPFSYLLFSIGIPFGRSINTIIYIGITFLLLFFSIYIFISNKNFVFYKNKYLFSFVIFIIFLLSYPTIFAIDRGNIDIWIASFCIVYVALLDTPYKYVGFISLSVAIMIKGYPLIFLILGLKRKEYRLVALTLSASILLTIVLMNFYWGGFTLTFNGLSKNMSGYYSNYVLGLNSLFGSSDIFSGIKSFLLMYKQYFLSHNILVSYYNNIISGNGFILNIYLACNIFVLCLSCFFILFLPLREWKRFLLVCLVAITFPNIANDYKLCLLYPGVLMLIFSGDSSRTACIALILCSLLMIPKSFIMISGYSISNLINPILLFSLFIVIFLDFKAWKFFIFNWLRIKPHANLY